MKILKIHFVMGLLSLLCFSAFSQGVISDRGALNILLGPGRIDEGFETIPLAVGSGLGGDGLLSSTNSGGSWPSDLVVSGITIRSAPENYYIEWNNFGENNTKTITAGTTITLDFWNPTSAFGIDLKDFPSRRVLVAGVTVFASDDLSIIYSNTNIPIADPANGNFFGFESLQGIGSVRFYTVIDASAPGYSPTIDNLSFGTVPEPSAMVLVSIGLGTCVIACRVRKK